MFPELTQAFNDLERQLQQLANTEAGTGSSTVPESHSMHLLNAFNYSC